MIVGRSWLFVLIATIAIVGGCSSGQGRSRSTISTQPDGLRTFSVILERDGIPVVCPAFGLVNPVRGTLRGDVAGTPDRVWLESGGRHLSIVWPGGFSLRFAPDAELSNEHGVVVAREGDLVELSQVQPDEHAGSFDDPYLASGILFDGCYPYLA
ncbi:MAG: hypothetical protein H0V07_05735 [Propionibacteriales bacterium]|nr:hypothetical protein [Propionibacteriales bacterium]